MGDAMTAGLWGGALAGLATIMVAGFILWVVSVRLRDASIVDPFWAPGFLLVGVTYALVHGSAGARGLAAVGLVGVWAGRLGWHLLRRNRREGEDRRYQAMRHGHGEAFWWVSLFTVFWLQGVILWVVSMPLLAAVWATGSMGWMGWGGVALAAAGIVVEGWADAQLKAFKEDPRNRGRVMDRGLWRYSRHPNYFGNAVLWWGLYLLAADGGGGWTVFSPLLMTFLLLRVSGVSLLERDIEDRRPEYRAYRERTSAFVPWPPTED